MSTLTVCYAVKGGSGTTVTAAAIALADPGDSLLVDLDGELPAVLRSPRTRRRRHQRLVHHHRRSSALGSTHRRGQHDHPAAAPRPPTHRKRSGPVEGPRRVAASPDRAMSSSMPAPDSPPPLLAQRADQDPAGHPTLLPGVATRRRAPRTGRPGSCSSTNLDAPCTAPTSNGPSASPSSPRSTSTLRSPGPSTPDSSPPDSRSASNTPSPLQPPRRRPRRRNKPWISGSTPPRPQPRIRRARWAASREPPLEPALGDRDPLRARHTRRPTRPRAWAHP